MNLRSILAAGMIFAGIVFLPGCDGTSGSDRDDNPVRVTGVGINKEITAMLVGSTETLTAMVYPGNASNRKIYWESSNESTVSVSDDGLLTARGVGNVVITATTDEGDFEDECAVNVSVSTVAVTGMELDMSSLKLHVDDRYLIKASIIPIEATNQNVLWESDDENIVEVHGGLLTATGVGTAVVSAITADGGFIGECTVTVSPKLVPVTDLTLNRYKAGVQIGKTLQIYATIHPSNATNRVIHWYTPNSDIATVTQYGLVTGIGAGEVNILAVSDDGDFGAECSVTVSPIAVTGVTLDAHDWETHVGETLHLNATVSPDDATNREVSWESNNEAVASVSPEGLVTANGLGTARITVSSDGGDFDDSCEVSVVPVYISGFELNKTSTTIVFGRTEQLVATINPSNSTVRDVTWESDDESIASVSDNGIVTSNACGTTVIRAWIEDEHGYYQAECEVRVAKYEYVASRWIFLSIVDVSDPFNPFLASRYVAEGTIYDTTVYAACVSGDHVYLAMGEKGLVILDVSDRTNPVKVGEYETINDALDVYVRGNYLIVAEERTVEIFDISEPEDPSSVWHYQSLIGGSIIASVDQDYLYIIEPSMFFNLYNISNPASPVSAGSNITNQLSSVSKIIINGNTAYLIRDSELVICDLEDLNDISPVEYYDTPDTIQGMCFNGNYAYINDGYNAGMLIVDMSINTEPVLVDTYPYIGHYPWLKVDSNYLYLSDAYTFMIFDVSTSSEPYEISSFDEPFN
ncbi:MAG TPA: Ig-like domain-containing protein [Spirochaetota bacterium]|nr:Ig-like domain-containing protein [Spirochaetota bacterium]